MSGWTLRCGAFEADIRRTTKGGDFILTINRHPITSGPHLQALQALAEETIVKRIEAVLPAYEVIKARCHR